MSEFGSERLAAVAGIGSVVVLSATAAIYLLVGEFPGAYDTPIDEVRRFFTEDRTAVIVAEMLNALSLVGFLWFLIGLRSCLARAGEDTAGSLTLVNGVVFVALSLVELAAILAIAESLAADPHAIASVRLLWELYHLLIGTIAVFPLAALVGAATLALHRSRALSGWVVLVGAFATFANLALVPGVFVTSGAYAPDGLLKHVVGDLSVQIWVVAASVTLLAKARRRSREAARHVREAVVTAQSPSDDS